MPEDNETHKLKEAQRITEEAEEKLARVAPAEEEAARHKRRADKARYLRGKLEERAESERKAR
jgi:hypothetical protein